MKKICNKCGTKNLTWNTKHHEKTGKWQLIDHRNKDGKWCVKNQNKTVLQIDSQIRLCELCDGTSFGLCRSESDYNHHRKVYHPNGEVLTELDWHMKQSPNKKPHEGWSCDPHYDKYVKSNRLIS